MRGGDWDKIAGEISDEMLSEFAITGPPEKIPGMLRERYAGLLDRVSLYYPIPPGDPDDAWKSFVDAFRQAG